MTRLGGCCARFRWTGTIKGEWTLQLASLVTDHLCSVRTKIRNYDGSEYYYGKDFFARCLYAGEKGDLNHVRTGYLRSTLLVKVTSSLSSWLATDHYF
jgi:hypothetical protein